MKKKARLTKLPDIIHDDCSQQKWEEKLYGGHIGCGYVGGGKGEGGGGGNFIHVM